jgi:hypothetical protein
LLQEGNQGGTFRFFRFTQKRVKRKDGSIGVGTDYFSTESLATAVLFFWDELSKGNPNSTADKFPTGL